MLKSIKDDFLRPYYWLITVASIGLLYLGHDLWLPKHTLPFNIAHFFEWYLAGSMLGLVITAVITRHEAISKLREGKLLTWEEARSRFDSKPDLENLDELTKKLAKAAKLEIGVPVRVRIRAEEESKSESRSPRVLSFGFALTEREIVLSEGFVKTADPNILRFTLAHEIAHMRGKGGPFGGHFTKKVLEITQIGMTFSTCFLAHWLLTEWMDDPSEFVSVGLCGVVYLLAIRTMEGFPRLAAEQREIDADITASRFLKTFHHNEKPEAILSTEQLINGIHPSACCGHGEALSLWTGESSRHRLSIAARQRALSVRLDDELQENPENIGAETTKAETTKAETTKTAVKELEFALEEQVRALKRQVLYAKQGSLYLYLIVFSLMLPTFKTMKEEFKSTLRQKEISDLSTEVITSLKDLKTAASTIQSQPNGAATNLTSEKPAELPQKPAELPQKIANLSGDVIKSLNDIQTAASTIQPQLNDAATNLSSGKRVELPLLVANARRLQEAGLDKVEVNKLTHVNLKDLMAKAYDLQETARLHEADTSTNVKVLMDKALALKNTARLHEADTSTNVKVLMDKAHDLQETARLHEADTSTDVKVLMDKALALHDTARLHEANTSTNVKALMDNAFALQDTAHLHEANTSTNVKVLMDKALALHDTAHLHEADSSTNVKNLMLTAKKFQEAGLLCSKDTGGQTNGTGSTNAAVESNGTGAVAVPVK